MTPMELRRQGLAALRKELGYVGMVRFLHQFDTGSGDYTKERHQWQDGLTVADIMAQMKERRDRA
ncbi:hypothetical protein [Oscillatoria sp. FACHB-1406]|uniref:hypothetical protein n=1 Tax=Oscillatoria sp. FACHB-1406 TaxID=2692846 RepID=UPI001687CD50|nr:hypothetical protein [Oscillatoria sp. FACHB-1406]MBD2578950.1 hypothetical protein [Oscillatoria sp. FACHB-1406]